MMETDPFEDIIAGLEEELEEIPQYVLDLDNYELHMRKEAVRQELLQSGQMVKTTTSRGRELQCELVTLMAEMTKREMR